jgi:hypothetical protein
MDRSRGRRDPWRSAKLAGHTILLSCSSLRLLAAAIGAEPEAGRIKGRAGINRRQRVAGQERACLCSHAAVVHSLSTGQQKRIKIAS